MANYRELAESLRNPNGPYFAENTPAMLALEAMVDVVGIANIFYALEHICDAKAEHLDHNWQDNINAKAWQRQANRCRKAALSAHGKTV